MAKLVCRLIRAEPSRQPSPLFKRRNRLRKDTRFALIPQPFNLTSESKQRLRLDQLARRAWSANDGDLPCRDPAIESLNTDA